jgi:hypothetical protein
MCITCSYMVVCFIMNIIFIHCFMLHDRLLNIIVGNVKLTIIVVLHSVQLPAVHVKQ